MNFPCFRMLLQRMDVQEQARHSTINHHAEGMDYLCLHRSSTLTIKIYLMERPVNTNSGYLVNPHSHRYAFSSALLRGCLHHIRFIEARGDDWGRHSYCSDSKRHTYQYDTTLVPYTTEFHENGSTYYVDPDEIHTLKLIEHTGPVMIGLMQYADVRERTELYLPPGTASVKYPESHRPSSAEMRVLRDRCLDLLEGAA